MTKMRISNHEELNDFVNSILERLAEADNVQARAELLLEVSETVGRHKSFVLLNARKRDI